MTYTQKRDEAAEAKYWMENQLIFIDGHDACLESDVVKDLVDVAKLSCRCISLPQHEICDACRAIKAYESALKEIKETK